MHSLKGAGLAPAARDVVDEFASLIGPEEQALQRHVFDAPEIDSEAKDQRARRSRYSVAGASGARASRKKSTTASRNASVSRRLRKCRKFESPS